MKKISLAQSYIANLDTDAPGERYVGCRRFWLRSHLSCSDIAFVFKSSNGDDFELKCNSIEETKQWITTLKINGRILDQKLMQEVVIE